MRTAEAPQGWGRGGTAGTPRSRCGLRLPRHLSLALPFPGWSCRSRVLPSTKLIPGHHRGPETGVCHCVLCRDGTPSGPCRPGGKLETTQTRQTRGEHIHRTHQPFVGLGTLSLAFSGIPTFAQNPMCQKVTQLPLVFRKSSLIPVTPHVGRRD